MESTVNQKEKDISQVGVIVSKTDLQGIITEVNEGFVEASGYTKAELLGQPHNILRHPDVPKAVFKDMWDTLVAGKPWVSVVKNRCKDGSHYWVEANMTPISDSGRIVGYLSVRRAITAQEKETAQQFYREIDRGDKYIVNGYVLSSYQKACLFHRIHPINLMVLMIGLLGLLLFMSSLQDDLIPEWLALLTGLSFLAISLAGRSYAFNRLGKAKNVMNKMREGDFTGQLDFYGDHSLSKLLATVKMMQVQLGAMVDDAKFQLERTTRLRAALHNASANIMMINKNSQILYLNEQMQQFLAHHRVALQSVCEGFNESELVGRYINEVFSNSEFSNMHHASTSECSLGGLIIHLKIQPVFNDNQQIGSVIEWVDLTQQRKIEDNLKNTLSLASMGHTNISINTQGLNGFFLDTSNNVNSLLSELNSIIENMVKVMTNLATGDLRERVSKELQGSLAAMKGATNVSLDNLSSIVLYIKRAADTVNTAANESSAAAMDLSDRTQQATATLQAINTSMQLVYQLQQENTAELIAVNQLAGTTISENNTAKAALDATIKAINDIQSTSNNIANIISLIDGIAFQTNLLALNAAVEAARAGEHGRGFAVVASEVRTLAQKSASAAQEIKVLIDESIANVKHGVNKVKETNRAFEVVNDKVGAMGNALDKVVLSIKDQQESVSEVAQSIEALDASLQSNAALVEQTSAAAESLQEQAELLHKETNKFVIDEKMASQLIQHNAYTYGVNIADVRQMMRIWRTNVQSYLNGVNVVIDLNSATQPKLSAVGVALEQMIAFAPEISSQADFIRVQKLHIKQHEIVRDVLKLIDQDRTNQGQLNLSLVKEKDALLDEFVLVTNELDRALATL